MGQRPVGQEAIIQGFIDTRVSACTIAADLEVMTGQRPIANDMAEATAYLVMEGHSFHPKFWDCIDGLQRQTACASGMTHLTWQKVVFEGIRRSDEFSTANAELICKIPSLVINGSSF
jgi:hypothetical protein